jgi:hypothetical protein
MPNETLGTRVKSIVDVITKAATGLVANVGDTTAKTSAVVVDGAAQTAEDLRKNSTGLVTNTASLAYGVAKEAILAGQRTIAEAKDSKLVAEVKEDIPQVVDTVKKTAGDIGNAVTKSFKDAYAFGQKVGTDIAANFNKKDAPKATPAPAPRTKEAIQAEKSIALQTIDEHYDAQLKELGNA